ncbi:MAG: helix-turn-helix domain-containing protein [Saprospirales bacterium]|nr:helix-turn-helix domain-containing protein [Saprospirales bacterium]
MKPSTLLHFLDDILGELQDSLSLIEERMEKVLESQKRNGGINPTNSTTEDELLERVQNLHIIQVRLHEQHAFLKKEEPEPLEDPFLRKVQSLFELRMADPVFHVAEFCEALQLSRSQLGRKIKAATGHTPALYFRALRIRKARELLKTTDLPIKEVAYAVGFTDPSYFTKVFTKEGGVPPSQMRK